MATELKGSTHLKEMDGVGWDNPHNEGSPSELHLRTGHDYTFRQYQSFFFDFRSKRRNTQQGWGFPSRICESVAPLRCLLPTRYG